MQTLVWHLTTKWRVEYVGEKRWGVPHGQGKMKAKKNAGLRFVEYEGEFKNGLFHGQGRIKYVDNGFCHRAQEYIGEFINGERGSTGILRKKNGEIYQGSFWNGWPCGPGRTTWPDGREFLVGGETGGEGIWTWPSQQGKRGRITRLIRCCQYAYRGLGPYPKRSVWQCTLEFEDETVYEGECDEVWPHGKGKWMFRDGSTYEGEFVHGIAQETGKWTMPNGQAYEGRFSWK